VSSAVRQTKNGGDWGVISASSDADRRSRGLASSPSRISRDGRVPDVERIAEHARLHAYFAEPAGHRLGFVRGVGRVPAAGQHDHVRAVRRKIHDQVLIKRNDATSERGRRGRPTSRARAGRDDARRYDGSLTGGAAARTCPSSPAEARESRPVRYPGQTWSRTGQGATVPTCACPAGVSFRQRRGRIGGRGTLHGLRGRLPHGGRTALAGGGQDLDSPARPGRSPQ
jgi:hypothetical protein